MEQVIFLCSLYLVGVLFNLPFKKRIPFTFLCVTGFLWGTLLWVSITIVLLSLSLPYSPIITSILIGAIAVVMIGIAYYQGNLKFSYKEVGVFIIIFLAFTITISAAVIYNLTYATRDSFFILIMAEDITKYGFSRWGMATPAAYGIFVPVLHSAKGFLGQDYLQALHPAIAFTFLLTFFYICNYAAKKVVSGKSRSAIFLSALTTLAFTSSYMVLVQGFYIHTNLLAAFYLFVSVSAFWLALEEDNKAWLGVGGLGLIGLGLCRTESPIFVLLILSLLVSSHHLSYRERLYTTLLPLTVLGAWYCRMLFMIGNLPGEILTPESTLAIIFLILMFAVLVAFSKQAWLQKCIIPYLHWIILLTLLSFLSIAFLVKPTNMLTNLTNIARLLLLSGGWGAIWPTLLGLAVLLPLLPRLPNERLFAAGTLGLFLLVLALGFLRHPYYAGWTDSANRMFLQILPIFCLYILLKYCANLRDAGNQQMVPPHSFPNRANPSKPSDIDRHAENSNQPPLSSNQ